MNTVRLSLQSSIPFDDDLGLPNCNTVSLNRLALGTLDIFDSKILIQLQKTTTASLLMSPSDRRGKMAYIHE